MASEVKALCEDGLKALPPNLIPRVIAERVVVGGRLIKLAVTSQASLVSHPGPPETWKSWSLYANSIIWIAVPVALRLSTVPFNCTPRESIWFGVDCRNVEGAERGRGACGQSKGLCLGSDECHRHEDESCNDKG